MKRLLIALLILFIIVPATVVLAAVTYSADITVANNGTTSYAQIGVTASENVTLLVSNGFITSSGLDSRVQQSGSNLPFMLATDRVTFAVPSVAGTSNVYQFVTGQTAASSFQIVTGYGGYVTTNYTATLDMGKNYSLPMGVYLSGTGNVLQNTHGLNVSYNATSGNVTTFISKDSVSSTSDGYATKNSGIYNTAWTAANADSVNSAITLPVGQRFAAISYDIYRSFLYFNTANISGNITSAILYLYLNVDSSTTDFNVVIQKGSAGHPADPLVVGDYDKTFYSGNYGSFNTAGLAAGYNAIPITDTSFINAGTTTNITIRSSNEIAGVAPVGDEFVNFESADAGSGKLPILYVTFTLNSVSGITNGYHVITPYADTTHAWTTVDSTSSGNTTAITTTDTVATSNYVFGSSATPYFNYIKMVIGGVEKLWYQPVAIINGTNLPDRDGTKDGDITWGSNPSGLTTSFGALISTTIISTNVTSSGYVGNFMPSEVHNDTSKTLAQAEAAVESDILYAFIKPFADTSGTQAVWFYWFGTILIAVVAFIFAYKTRHLLIAAIAWDIPFGYGIAKGYIPWWVIIILALWTIGAAIQEARM